MAWAPLSFQHFFNRVMNRIINMVVENNLFGTNKKETHESVSFLFC